MKPAIVKAKQVVKKELFNGTRLTEFQYKYKLDTNFSTNKLFDIVCANHELELVWSIEHDFSYDHSESRYGSDNNERIFKLNKIKLTKCNEKIHGNFSAAGENENFTKFIFDATSLQKEKKLWRSVKCKNGDKIVFTVQVYREDEKIISAIQDFSGLLENKSTCDVTFFFEKEEEISSS